MSSIFKRYFWLGPEAESQHLTLVQNHEARQELAQSSTTSGAIYLWCSTFEDDKSRLSSSIHD